MMWVALSNEDFNAMQDSVDCAHDGPVPSNCDDFGERPVHLAAFDPNGQLQGLTGLIVGSDRFSASATFFAIATN
jgi:hypothetical protein